MIESTTYKDSVANGELVPQITLSPLADPKEEWGALEVASILTKVTAQWFNIGDSIGVSVFYQIVVKKTFCKSLINIFLN